MSDQTTAMAHQGPYAHLERVDAAAAVSMASGHTVDDSMLIVAALENSGFRIVKGSSMPTETSDRLTAEHTSDGLYRLSFPWPAPHAPVTYTVEAREVGSNLWLAASVHTARKATWRAPRASKTGWEVRVSAASQRDGRYRSEIVVLQNV